MLIQSCLDLDIIPYVLDPEINSPCHFISQNHLIESFREEVSFHNFWRKYQFKNATIEIEDVSIEGLKFLEKQGVAVFPQIEILETIRDKGLQKQFYYHNSLPTSPFVLVDELKPNLALELPFNYPFVQKIRVGGYDGKGVKVIQNPDDLRNSLPGASVLEKKIDIQKEISVIVVHNPDDPDGLRVHPPVEMVFHPTANLVQYLIAPADLSPNIAKQCTDIAITIAQKLGIRGLLAVELFVDREDKVWINEIAPRPHNSGHFTIEACYTSQFENHLRAILGYPLGESGLVIPAAMINIIGSASATGTPKYDALKKIMQIKGTRLHLYGKNEVKPFRKMGHITIMNKDRDQLIYFAREIEKILLTGFN